MKKYFLFFFLFNLVWGQVNLSNLKNLSNDELDLIKNELSKRDKSSSIDSIKDKPEGNSQNEYLKEININNKSKVDIVDDEENKNFGYDYFDSEINFFDNIPTPENFKLGPGDEIILSLWGEINSRKTLLINKSGLVFFDNLGFINLSNKTISEAENLLISELSKIYASLNVNTSLMLELSRIKSINVFFTGEVNNPGISLIHPFSDIFSALVQAGGVKDSGTLRNIQLIRNGEIVENIDFYSFLISGVGNFQKINIIEGDVIHVPAFENRVEIKGEIKRPKFYELKSSESLSDLINYAGGLTASSSRRAVLYNILPSNERISDEQANSGNLIDLSLAKEVFMNNGSSITILPIANNQINVSVLGRVLLPGEYPIEPSSTTLKDILDVAGGFENPIYKRSIKEEIVVLRISEDNIYGKEFTVKYENAESFILEVSDKILVYGKSDYFDTYTYSIDGEVNYPGIYPLQQNLTLGAAIELAGGLTKRGSMENVFVISPQESISSDGLVVMENRIVSNVNNDFRVSNETKITILSKSNFIFVDGNVYNPGLISITNPISVKSAIDLAGGLKPDSIKKDIFIIRANGEREKLLIARAKKLYPGDSIFIPVNTNPKDFDISTFIADLSTTIANIAAIIFIVNSNSN